MPHKNCKTCSCDKPWKPKLNDYYFFIGSLGDIISTRFYKDGVDRERVNFGNYFETREKAKNARNKVAKLLKEIKKR
jgi:hypothetical protein